MSWQTAGNSGQKTGKREMAKCKRDSNRGVTMKKKKVHPDTTKLALKRS